MINSNSSSIQDLISKDLITFDERVRKRRSHAIKMVYADVGGKKGDLVAERFQQGEDEEEALGGFHTDLDPRDNGKGDSGADKGRMFAPGPIGEAIESSQAHNNIGKHASVKASVHMTPPDDAPSPADGDQSNSQPTGASDVPSKPAALVQASISTRLDTHSDISDKNVDLVPPEGQTPRTASTTWPGALFRQSMANPTQVSTDMHHIHHKRSGRSQVYVVYIYQTGHQSMRRDSLQLFSNLPQARTDASSIVVHYHGDCFADEDDDVGPFTL